MRRRRDADDDGARARTVDDEENARGAIDRVGVRDGDRGLGSGVDGERM